MTIHRWYAYRAFTDDEQLLCLPSSWCCATFLHNVETISMSEGRKSRLCCWSFNRCTTVWDDVWNMRQDISLQSALPGSIESWNVILSLFLSIDVNKLAQILNSVHMFLRFTERNYHIVFWSHVNYWGGSF